jgi:TolB protein
VKPDGSGLAEITPFVEDGQPNWSADGKRLVFSSTRHGDKRYRVYVIDGVPFSGGKVDGRSLNYGPDDVRGQMAAWTQDGRIVYRGCAPHSGKNACEGFGLFVISSDPGPQPTTRLTEHPEDTAPAVYGNQVAFMSNRDGNWEIYRVKTDGSDLKRLTIRGAHDGLPVWSPDGKSIGYVSNEGGAWAIWAMNADGTNQRKLFDVGGGGLPSDWQHERIGWSP